MQKKARIAIYTEAGWITGRLHLEEAETLLGYLNYAGPFFSLSNARLPVEDAQRPFFAVHAKTASIVLPLEAPELHAPPAPLHETKSHRIACLLPGGTLFCQLDVFAGHRVSDHLMNHPGFIHVRDVTVPIMELPASVVQPIPVAYLNTAQIIGVTETGVPAKPEEETRDKPTRDSFKEI